MRKRNDARFCYDVPAYNQIFPFLMKRRCDALVYHTFELDVTGTVNYIRAYNSRKPELRMKFFYVFCAALLRTIALRPELNRFIASNRYWQRDELSLNFVVKENFTDEAPETSTPLTFDPKATVQDYAKALDAYINSARKASKSTYTDDVIERFLHLPVWLLAGVVKLLGFMDRRGKAPKFVRDADGMHTSVFISNLGSIGITGGSPLHHLYEWGTTSLFITLGNLERKREFDDDGKVISCKETVQVGVTVDERITSGFYFIKSILLFQDLLNHPEQLEKVPEVPRDTLTRKEYKALKRQRRLDRRRASKEAEPSEKDSDPDA